MVAVMCVAWVLRERQVSCREPAIPLIAALVLSLALVLVGCEGTATEQPGAGATAAPKHSAAPQRPLELVAIGDSIPFNSPYDCPNCTGFVQRYAKAVGAATGRAVHTTNLSQHTGLTLPQLLDELDGFHRRLARADVVVVGIAHNSNELAADEPCGAPLRAGEQPDWSKLTAECSDASAARYRPQFEALYSQIAAWRNGKPTILRTINRYNDWIGFPDLHLTRAQQLKTKLMIDPWNTMLCATATKNGFECADIYRTFNGPDGLTPSGKLLGTDYTHPSDQGNTKIADVLTMLGFAPLA
jgi:lysophospholipase L1-like esterase